MKRKIIYPIFIIALSALSYKGYELYNHMVDLEARLEEKEERVMSLEYENFICKFMLKMGIVECEKN